MLTKYEILKDTLQVAVESGATRVGRIAGIIAGTVRDVTREIGGWGTDVFEALDAARRADADRERRAHAAPHDEEPPQHETHSRTKPRAH